MHEISIPKCICTCGCHRKTQTENTPNCCGCMFSAPCCEVYGTHYINDDNTLDLKNYNDSWRVVKHSRKNTPFIDGGEFIVKKKSDYNTEFIKEKRRNIKST